MDAEPQTSETPLVCIVDDDVSVRRSTCRLVRSFGVRVEAFASAEDFLNSERVVETACLLLDLRMPGMDGLELQRRLGQRERRIPIVFLSAQATDQEERLALQSGALDFLRKPFSKEALLRVIRTALANPDGTHGKDYDDQP